MNQLTVEFGLANSLEVEFDLKLTTNVGGQLITEIDGGNAAGIFNGIPGIIDGGSAE